MKRSFWSVLSLLIVLSLVLSACATPTAAPQPAQPPAAAPAATAAPAAAAPTNTPLPTPTAAPIPEGATKIAFWHSMGGDIGGKAIPKLATDFNLAQQTVLRDADLPGQLR